MAGQCKTYPLTNPEAVAAKIKELDGPAIDPSQETGEAVTHGVHLSWVISNGEITVAVGGKPFYIGYDTIFNKLDELFAGSE